jgi:hypothetical protein
VNAARADVGRYRTLAETGAGLRLVVGMAAVGFTAIYFVSDLVEVAQGDFSTFRLVLTYIGEAAIPFFVLGLYAIHDRRTGLLGFLGALAYAYSYVFFTSTVVYALVAHTRNWAALTKEFGVWMTVHGVILVLGGLGFGLAVARARVLPRWTGVCLMVGVVFVAAASGLPNLARTIAAAVPAIAFIGMGVALLRHPHAVSHTGASVEHVVEPRARAFTRRVGNWLR